MPIQRLSVQLANQIAAGEVVERPASVVKELMENAIDAKATSITLEIAKSGKNLIKVTDNGAGIPQDELVLALAPHATSKISKLEDLDAIYTLGFRGEALASIASVSKLTLTSRTKEQEHAFQVEVSGPEQNPDVQPAAHPVGTSVVVRELFFNTPARRRFLKADKTEFNHIKELFIRLALVNYGIEFKFISDGKVILHVQGIKKADISQRIGKLLGLEFRREGMFFDSSLRHGKQDEASLAQKQNSQDALSVSALPTFDLDAEPEPVIKLFGVILPPPSFTQSIPDRLLTFLNGRMIADKTVNHAIKEGYMDSILKPHDNFKPSVRAVIFMECDPHIVDVNVHPRKDEVRFHNSNLIHETIKQEIIAVLDAYGLNQHNANQAVLDPSLVVDKEKLENKLEPKVTAVEQAQQRLVQWQQQAERSKGSVAYEEQMYKNEALQTFIDEYFKQTPQALRAPATGPCNLPGRLCDFRQVRTPISELDARKRAQREYDAYHHRVYGSAAKISPQAQEFMERVHPVLKSDIKAQAELMERQARDIAERELHESLDEFGNLKQAFDLDDLVGHSSEPPVRPYQGGARPLAVGNTLVGSADANSDSYTDAATDASADTGIASYTGKDAVLPVPSSVFNQQWHQAEQDSLKASLHRQIAATSLEAKPTESADTLEPVQILQPQREHAPSLFDKLDKTSFLGTGNSALGSSNAGHKIQQRYNQQILGLHNLQNAVTAENMQSALEDKAQHAEAVSTQDNLQQSTRKATESEVVAPAGTGSAFNSAQDLGHVSRVPHTKGNEHEDGQRAPMHSEAAVFSLDFPGTDTLDPLAKMGQRKQAPDYTLPHLQVQSLSAYAEPVVELKIRTAHEEAVAAQAAQNEAHAAESSKVEPMLSQAESLDASARPSADLLERLGLSASTAQIAETKGKSLLDSDMQSHFLSLIAHDVILFTLENRYYVGRGSELYYSFAARNFLRQLQRDAVESFELQMPFGVKCADALLRNLRQAQVMQAIKRCGFEIGVNLARGIIEIAKVPMLLTSTDLAREVPRILGLLLQDAPQIVHGECRVEIAQEIARVRKFEVSSEADAKLLLSRIDSFELLQNVKHSADIKELKLHNLALSMLRSGDDA